MEQKKSFEERFRIIKRQSDDGVYRVCEDINGDYAITENGVIIAIYEHLQHAYRQFGILTRK